MGDEIAELSQKLMVELSDVTDHNKQLTSQLKQQEHT